MHDPLSAVIEAAVSRAIDAQLPTIIEAVKNAANNPPPEQDRFYPIKEAATLLGKSPSTIWRLERSGQMPPRERLGGSVGYRASTIKTILDGIGFERIAAPETAIKKGERRGRKGGAV